MQEITNFEKSLCESARLFSISKKNLDLFLLLQSNTITYQQLFQTGLHGSTEASGRLSLKRLENEGYIIGRQLSTQSQSKFFTLTPKGRAFIRKLLPESYTDFLQINWSRRPPGGSQQILHRIHSNDFYFSYVSQKESLPLPWTLEKQLPGSFQSADTLPRSDGFLQAKHSAFYIEQDNSTQSETVLAKKIAQYCTAGIFDSDSSSILVFCLAFPHRGRSQQKPAFSLYKIVLKFSKLWALCEENHGIPLDYQQFIHALQASPLIQTVTSRELSAFENIKRLNPSMDTLSDATVIKKSYLDDTGDFRGRLEELDSEYRKRLKSHFSRLYDNNDASMYISALNGTPLFAVPNHRLQACLPYIMQEELNFKALLFRHLFYCGLNTDGWEYCCPLQIHSGQSASVTLRLGLKHPSFGYIAVESPSFDLSSKIRLSHFVKGCANTEHIRILLLDDPHCLKDVFLKDKEIWNTSATRHPLFLFIDINSLASDDAPSMQIIENGTIGSTILLECDDFDETLRIIRKEQANETNIF